MQVCRPCPKLSEEKLIRFSSKSDNHWKITITIEKKVVSLQFEHKRYSFGHVESSFYNRAETISSKPWKFVAQCPEKN